MGVKAGQTLSPLQLQQRVTTLRSHILVFLPSGFPVVPLSAAQSVQYPCSFGNDVQEA